MIDRLKYEEGGLYWKDGPRKGKRAGTIDHTTGYRRVRLGGTLVYEHRVIWEMFYGEVPNIIDHINHNKLDNRIENLRNCCQAVNQTNRKPKVDKDNTSGHRGVSWDKGKKMWEAYMTTHKRRNHLGYFSNLDEAVTARRQYALKHVPA